MKINIYIKLFFSILVILTGLYYFDFENIDRNLNFWLQELNIVFIYLIGCLVLLEFNFKNFPKRNNYYFNSAFILPIFIGIIGYYIINCFVPILLFKLLNIEIEIEKKSFIEITKFIPLMLIGVIIEELFFRRIISQMILNINGYPKALWISAFLFAISHLFTTSGFLSVFLGGVFLGYIYLKSQNIYVVMFAHISNNLLIYFLSNKIVENNVQYNSYPKLLLLCLIGVFLLVIMVYLINKQLIKTSR